MSITYTAAWLELTDSATTHTVDSLFKLVSRVSGEVQKASPGSTYLLFSGTMPDGVTRALDVVGEIINHSSNNFSIGDSEIGKLLIKDEFTRALRGAITREILGSVPIESATSAQLRQIDEMANLLLSGTDLNGKRISSGSIWDIASKNYTAAAEGNFRIVAPTRLDELSTFVQSELPALLANPNVQTIDGIERAE